MAHGIGWRPATVDEAVASIMRCHSREERARQLSFFREKNGEHFAQQVESIVKTKWKSK